MATLRGSLFDRLVAPWALFLGAVVGFAGCCAAGWVVGRQNPFERFERFHVFLTPYTHFYPTASQVGALARARLDPNKIAVIIGGDSVMQGLSQAPARVWTKKLQALLGDQYQVINFGFYGAHTGEFAAVAAETLARDYPKLILVANQPLGNFQTDPDGYAFKYFFWDAYFKGLLLPHPERDARLLELDEETEPEQILPTCGMEPAKKFRPKKCRLAELRTEMRIDSALRFNDLWNTLGYEVFFTVWTYLTADSFILARQYYADPDQGREPNRDLHFAERVADLRAIITDLASPHTHFWPELERSARCTFPEAVRKRTLILVTWTNPLYFPGLTSRERAEHARISARTVASLRKWGFAAVEVGKDFAPTDYFDFGHLVAPGGAKLAAVVAPRVRALARRLGYEKGGGR
jgi:hypothetical protein